jgi:hypothetical protein
MRGLRERQNERARAPTATLHPKGQENLKFDLWAAE